MTTRKSYTGFPTSHQRSPKKYDKKPKHVTRHVFAETNHVVVAPHGFACVFIPVAQLYVPNLIQIRLGVLEPRGWGSNLTIPIISANGFTTACIHIRNFFISYLCQLFFRHVVGQALQNVSYSDITFFVR